MTDTTTVPATVTIIPEVTLPADAPERVQNLLERGRQLQDQVDEWARACFELFAPLEVATTVMGVDLEDLAGDILPGWDELHSTCFRITALAEASHGKENTFTHVPWLKLWELAVLWPAELASPSISDARRENLEHCLALPRCEVCGVPLSGGASTCDHRW